LCPHCLSAFQLLPHKPHVRALSIAHQALLLRMLSPLTVLLHDAAAEFYGACWKAKGLASASVLLL
jgi:hypothetical protein